MQFDNEIAQPAKWFQPFPGATGARPVLGKDAHDKGMRPTGLLMEKRAPRAPHQRTRRSSPGAGHRLEGDAITGLQRESTYAHRPEDSGKISCVRYVAADASGRPGRS